MGKMAENILRLGPDCPEVPVLYEDADMLALDKPAGLLMVPDRWDKTKPSLAGLLNRAVAEGRPWVRERGIEWLANVHRLDKGTSGVALFARHRRAMMGLVTQFRSRETRKTYLALVFGVLPSSPMTIDLPIAVHLQKPGLSRISKAHGKASTTEVEMVERFGRFSLVRAHPLTGRHHQVRIHLAEVGCPLIADPDYGNGHPLLLSELKRHYKSKAEGEHPLMGRTALHAEALGIRQPSSGQFVEITAPIPKDFSVAVKYLRRFSV